MKVDTYVLEVELETTVPHNKLVLNGKELDELIKLVSAGTYSSHDADFMRGEEWLARLEKLRG